MFARAMAIIAFVLATSPAVAGDPQESAYDFHFTAIEGTSLPMAEFRGKVVLVVNTASFCGFTHQYADLQTLWQRYRARGFVLLGVPSNDFGGQEPGTSAEIKNFCEVNFDIDFPLTEKVPVTGKDAHPFYKWAVGVLGDQARPRWNFHKYLVGADGRLAGWFPTATEPASPEVVRAIEAELAKAAPAGG